MHNPAIISTAAVKKKYPGQSDDALKNVDIEVDQGCLFGLIGADGAGKTTLLKIIATLITPDSGTVSVLGHDISAGREKIRTSIGFMPQRFSLYQDLSVIENIHFFADIFGVKGDHRKKRLERLLAFSRLDRFVSRRAEHLSGGMKQKLSLCCALIHSPRLLILDEPTTGVDPVSRNEFWSILQELVLDGVSIFVSTPYMDETRYCSKLALLHEGTILCRGTPREIIDSYPHAVFRGSSAQKAYPFGPSVALPGFIRRLYPAAGAFKIAAQKDAGKEKVAAWVRSVAPDVTDIEECPAEMEDVFIEKISG